MNKLILFRTPITVLPRVLVHRSKLNRSIGTHTFLRLIRSCTHVIYLNNRHISNLARCNQIQVKKDGGVSTQTRKEKTKQAAKDTTYGLIVVAGISCMAFVFYILYKELLSKAGPTQVFGDALERCREHQELSVALGLPIEGYGETNSRGRRRHVSHLAYIDSMGRDAMRLKFHVKGSSGRRGTVQVDAVIVGRKISYRYIIAYLETYPRRIIIVVDERSEIDKADSGLSSSDL